MLNQWKTDSKAFNIWHYKDDPNYVLFYTPGSRKFSLKKWCNGKLELLAETRNVSNPWLWASKCVFEHMNPRI